MRLGLASLAEVMVETLFHSTILPIVMGFVKLFAWDLSLHDG